MIQFRMVSFCLDVTLFRPQYTVVLLSIKGQMRQSLTRSQLASEFMWTYL